MITLNDGSISSPPTLTLETTLWCPNMNAKKYFLTRPFFQEFENGCKVTFGALRGAAVAFKKIIKVKPTLVQVLPTLISKKNHVLSAANHSSRELERRTNLALQSSPEDFKS